MPKMPSRSEFAAIARKEAFAMCKGCPLSQDSVMSFVTLWVECELRWFDSIDSVGWDIYCEVQEEERRKQSGDF